MKVSRTSLKSNFQYISCKPGYRLDSYNYIYECGSTIFTYAIRQNANRAIVQHIISNGGSINTREKEGATPLHVAIFCNNFDIVQFLIEKRADIKLKLSTDTCVSLAIRRASFEIVEYLINAGAEVSYDDLRLAIQMHKYKIYKLLLSKELVFQEDSKFFLEFCIENNCSLEILKTAIEDDEEDINRVTNDMTPLMLAAEIGNIQACELLLKKGADIHLLNKNGNSALDIATQGNHYEMVKLLIRHDFKCYDVDKNGQTLLKLSIVYEDIEMIKCFLNHGGSFIIDFVFLDAIATQNLEIVKILTEHGAVLNKNNTIYGDLSPIEKAVAIKNSDISKFLVENGVDIMKEIPLENLQKYFCNFIQDNDLKMMNFFLEFSKLPLMDRKNKGLYYAISQKNSDVVWILLEKLGTWNERISIEGSTVNGYTSLMIMVYLQNINLVKKVLAKTIDINKTSEEGLSPLALALSIYNTEIFELLIENDAAPNSDENEKNSKLIRFYEITKKKFKKVTCDDMASNQEPA